jgi:UDP-N-acetylglucosamine diphosphorylase/glucosamine-1-phosphate N-acetyltransferase
MIRGPFSLGEGATLKMGAKVYGATTIGPYCKVGGEVNNSIFLSYSNKAHDGFIGNSVIGEWCNLGADTNNSNLKNNYGEVKMYSYRHKKEITTGLQFCGVVLGDHTKTGINTMLNTGTVAGVSANIFGDGFPPKYIPSFGWGGAPGFTTYKLEKAVVAATKMYERRSLKFDHVEENIFQKLFEEKDR